MYHAEYRACKNTNFLTLFHKLPYHLVMYDSTATSMIKEDLMDSTACARWRTVLCCEAHLTVLSLILIQRDSCPIQRDSIH